jgi:FtsP/CotA-like multicopper oxidase with cupredoxin domain
MRSILVALCVLFVVGSAARADAQVRTYYIAADEVLWNYAPSGKDMIANKALPPLAASQLGWTYRKALYREYTDATFRHLKPRPQKDDYLGLLGPVIHAEVGDTIKIVFKNNTHLHLSVHPHGVFYKKDSEGAPYQDGTMRSSKGDDSVAPGGVYTYNWDVPERAGPGPADGSSIVWMYHSHTDETRDINTGPIGPIIVTARGMANPDGTPKDVDDEFITMFSEMDESQSRLVARNVSDRTLNPKHVKATDPAFQFTNQFFSLNGYVFGNMPMITLKKGERARWYVMASMSDFDFHSPDWHGDTVLDAGNRVNVLALGPMEMKTVDMVPEHPGTWLYTCDINVHLQAGLVGRYKVLP